MDDQEQLKLRVRVAKAKAKAAETLLPVPQKHDTSIEDELGALMAPTRTALDSASLGILPRVLAAGDSVAQVADPRGPKLSEIGDLYNSNLTKQQADAEKRAADHPSGAITGGFIPGVLPIGVGATLLQRLAMAGGLGALSGNLNAPHANDAKRLEGTLEGGLGGIGMQALGEVPGVVASRLGGPSASARLAAKLRDMAGSNAAGVLTGGRAGISDKFAKIGLDPSDVSDFGARALDEGLIPSGLNPLESPVEGALARTRAAKKAQGVDIGDAINAADVGAGGHDPLQTQDAMRIAIATDNPQREANSIKALKFIDQVGELTPQGNRAGPGNGFREAQDMKSEAWNGANFKEDAPQEAKQYRRAVGGMAGDLVDQVGASAGDDAASKLARANEKYGYLSDVEKLAKPAASREGQLQKFGLPAAAASLAAAGVGLGAEGHGATGASLGALAGGALLKARGPVITSRLQYLGSQAAPAVGELLTRPAASGGAGSAVARYLDPQQDAGDKLQSLGETVADAAPKGLTSDMAGSLRAIAARAQPRNSPTVDVRPMEPTITSRKPSTVDVQALDPTSMVTTHQPLTPEEEEAEAQARRMKLARFFGGGTSTDDEFQVQR